MLRRVTFFELFPQELNANFVDHAWLNDNGSGALFRAVAAASTSFTPHVIEFYPARVSLAILLLLRLSVSKPSKLRLTTSAGRPLGGSVWQRGRTKRSSLQKRLKL